MDKKNIKVSIICLVYNHEAYLQQALDGFVNQKTDFAFEVIIHDDASTDNSAAIIREYERKYPAIIKPIYQNENQHSRHIPIIRTHIIDRIQGDYVALCEGDDYWVDPEKLQMQVNFMEEHTDCSMCVHGVSEVNVNGQCTGSKYPAKNLPTGVILSKDFLDMTQVYSFQTSSYFFRSKDYRKYVLNPLKCFEKCKVGDEKYMMYFGTLANVGYINRFMSCYRRGVPGSWSVRINANPEAALSHNRDMLETITRFDEYTQKKYHSVLVKRMAKYLLNICTQEGTYKKFLTKQYRECFMALSWKRKLFVITAVFFPGLMYRIHRKIRQNYVKSHGLNQ